MVTQLSSPLAAEGRSLPYKLHSIHQFSYTNSLISKQESWPLSLMPVTLTVTQAIDSRPCLDSTTTSLLTATVVALFFYHQYF